jgi:TolB-like protein
MKNLLTAIILGIVFAGVSLSQTSPEVKIAVVEFSPGPNASGMTAEAKLSLQTSLAHALFKTDKFDVVDARWTRNESKENLADINSSSSTATAVKLGKKLGVSFVLTGIVVEYTPKDSNGFGRVVLKTRLIEVSTGKVKHAGETTQRSTSAMRTTNAAEMQAKTIKPAIENLTAALVGLRL